MKRAVLWGAAIALLVFAGAIVVAVGILNPPSSDRPLNQVIVIATVPGPDGGEVAPLGFILDSGGGVESLDMLARASTSGATARTVRDAYPFGGGRAVVGALKPQLAGRELEWVVVPADELEALIDQQGGVEVELPSGLSVYDEATLTVLPGGHSTLDGAGVVALLSAVDYVDGEQRRSAVTAAAADTAGAAILSAPGGLARLIGDGAVTSSVDADRLSW